MGNILKKILIMGGKGGGQASVAIINDINRKSPTYQIEGFLNDSIERNGKMGKYPVIGSTNNAKEFANKGYCLAYAIHNNRVNKQRTEYFRSLNLPIEAFPNLIHPSAVTSMGTTMGYGNIIGPNMNFMNDTRIGNFCFFSGLSSVGHDTVLEDFVIVNPNVTVGSYIRIKTGCHLAFNSCLRERITLNQFALVGMGAVVLNDIDEFNIVAGNPARVIGSVDKYLKINEK